MKKSFLVLVTVLAIQMSYAQTEKGKMFVGGMINLAGSNSAGKDSLISQDNSSFVLKFAPTFGYFIKNNLAVGASLNIGISNSSQDRTYTHRTPQKTTATTNTMEYVLGGFVRPYFNITEHFKFYINGGINYLYSPREITTSQYDPNQVYPTTSQKDHSTNISIAVTPGFVYFASPKLGFEATFGNLFYTYSSLQNTRVSSADINSQSNYGLNLDPSTFSLGLNYYF